MDEFIASLPKLDEAHKHLFFKAGIIKTADIWLHAASDVAKKLKISVDEVQTAIDAVCSEVTPVPKTLDHTAMKAGTTSTGKSWQGLRFTTGDAVLDEQLGGGIPVCMVTEISGGS
jgi:hypothetical protein